MILLLLIACGPQDLSFTVDAPEEQPEENDCSDWECLEYGLVLTSPDGTDCSKEPCDLYSMEILTQLVARNVSDEVVDVTTDTGCFAEKWFVRDESDGQLLAVYDCPEETTEWKIEPGDTVVHDLNFTWLHEEIEDGVMHVGEFASCVYINSLGVCQGFELRQQ